MTIDLNRIARAARQLRDELSGEMPASAVPHVLAYIEELREAACEGARRATPEAALALPVMRDLLAQQDRAHVKPGIAPLGIYFVYLRAAACETNAILGRGLKVAFVNGEWGSYVNMWQKRAISGWNFLCLRGIGLRYVLGWSSPRCITACERRARTILNLIYRVSD